MVNGVQAFLLKRYHIFQGINCITMVFVLKERRNSVENLINNKELFSCEYAGGQKNIYKKLASNE